MSKLSKITENYYWFHCPGCKYEHCVSVNGKPNRSGASWTWNGSMDSPTFSPSILCNPDFPEHRCHCFVKEGYIQFLDDCFHSLKGQTVELPEQEE